MSAGAGPSPGDSPAVCRGPLARFFNNPAVLLTMLLCVVGAITWSLTRPATTNQSQEPDADEAALRRAVASGKLMHFESEAQRLYRRGLGQCREGDLAGAQQTWSDVALLFRESESERAWVQLAESGLRMLQNAEKPAQARRAAVARLLEQIREHQDAGRMPEAGSLREALKRLYGDDPAVRDLLAEPGRK